MRVAIIHYWFVSWRGGEKVVEALLGLYPDADIFTHVYCEQGTGGKLRGRKIHETFISKMPKAVKLYQKYLPLMPIALEQLDLREYDLIISSESGPAKGIVSRPDALHVCYCHTPMRYVWDMYPDYISTAGRITRVAMRPLIHYLKIWDRLSADRVDFFVANSNFVAKRIDKFYRRDACVIHPPVDVSEFELISDKSDYYIVLGQLTPYKRADLVVDAFIENGKKLIVIGDGEQYAALKSKENGNIKVMGRMPWEDCKRYLSHARALIFPGVEDFGMVPIESMACGTPVLAYAEGGALETVVDEVTGYFFYEQSTNAINECVRLFEKNEGMLEIESMREQAENFSSDVFAEKIDSFIKAKL